MINGGRDRLFPNNLSTLDTICLLFISDPWPRADSWDTRAPRKRAREGYRIRISGTPNSVCSLHNGLSTNWKTFLKKILGGPSEYKYLKSVERPWKTYVFFTMRKGHSKRFEPIYRLKRPITRENASSFTQSESV